MAALQAHNFDVELEAAKVIALRDKLLDQASKTSFLDADASTLTPDLVRFRNRYKRFVIEKRLIKKREQCKNKNANVNLQEGRLHLVEMNDIKVDPLYQQRLDEALAVKPPPLPDNYIAPPPMVHQAAGAMRSSNVARPPPPPSAALPYDDEPHYTQSNTPTVKKPASLPRPNSSTVVSSDTFHMYSDQNPNMPELVNVGANAQWHDKQVAPLASTSSSTYEPPVFNKQKYKQTIAAQQKFAQSNQQMAPQSYHQQQSQYPQQQTFPQLPQQPSYPTHAPVMPSFYPNFAMSAPPPMFNPYGVNPGMHQAAYMTQPNMGFSSLPAMTPQGHLEPLPSPAQPDPSKSWGGKPPMRYNNSKKSRLPY